MTRQRLLPVLGVVAVLAFGALGCDRGAAQAYPSRSIDLVIHGAPGTTADGTARMVADIIEKEKLAPQPVNVLNKPGSGGAVALSYLYEKKGDAYTVAGFQNVQLVTTLSGQAGGISHKSFTPISNLMFDPNVIMVRTESKYKTMGDLIEDAKKRPGQVSIGFGSIGSADHIIAFRVSQLAGAQFNYISFSGGSEAFTQMLGGHVDFCGGQPGEAAGMVEAGKIRVLAVALDKRLPTLPNVPTLAELGIPVVFYQFRGIVGPPDMPQSAAQYLENTLKKVTETTRWREYLQREGSDQAYKSSSEFGKFLDQWAGQLEPVINAMGLNKK